MGRRGAVMRGWRRKEGRVGGVSGEGRERKSERRTRKRMMMDGEVLTGRAGKQEEGRRELKQKNG